MNTPKEAPLERAANHLERALASATENRQQAWLDVLRQALTELDGTVFGMTTPSEGQLLTPVEPAQRDLSPKLTRQVEALGSDLGQMTAQVNSLLGKLQGAPANPDSLRELRSAGERLLMELRAFHEAESTLVLETAMRDTGAGD